MCSPRRGVQCTAMTICLSTRSFVGHQISTLSFTRQTDRFCCQARKLARRQLIVEACCADGSCRFFGQHQNCQASPWLALSESACTSGRPQTRYTANAFASDSPAEFAHNLHCSAPASRRSAGHTQGVLPFLSFDCNRLFLD